MDTLRSQLVQRIEALPEATLKSMLLSLVQSNGDEHAIKALQQAFIKTDGWEAIGALVGAVDAPSDWASEHDHYLYNTLKRSSVDE